MFGNAKGQSTVIVRGLSLLLLLNWEQGQAHPLNLEPNRNWNCVKSRATASTLPEARIFGLIRMALHREQRNVYFALDTSWMDNLLRFDAKVTVTVTLLESIGSLVMPDPDPLSLPSHDYLEEYQVIYAELGHGGKYEQRLYEGVDTFLSLNPCWMPLQEPNMEAYGWRGAHQHRSNSHASPPLVLVRLPIHGFHATCRLFTRITQLQYPSQCRYDAEHMLTHHLHNTGWSATFNAILFKLAHVMHQDVFPRKVLAITRAIDFRSRPRVLVSGATGEATFNFSSGGWYWANPATCPQRTDVYDPYACNFISISNCTRKEAGVSPSDPAQYPPASRDYNWETPQTVRWAGFDLAGGKDSPSIQTLRGRFSDAPLFEEEQWCYSRFHTFLQRPNARLRAAMKRSFRSVEFLHPGSSAAATGTGMGTGMRTGKGGGGSGGSGIHPAATLKKMQPCLAIHVRHGDSRHDTRGDPRRRIDRSLAAHVLHARNLTVALALNTVYLASDNASVIARAAFDHPHLHWATQRRPIKDWPGMYDVHNEDDMTLELAHVFVDTRIAASCDAIVGSFDSGFAEQMLIAGCQLSRQGRCPPSVDLREVYKDYG